VRGTGAPSDARPVPTVPERTAADLSLAVTDGVPQATSPTGSPAWAANWVRYRSA
jgi:hypothetical protein